MSRMGKDRGEVGHGGGRSSSKRQALQSGRGRPPPTFDGDFDRAFADALRDILLHERRRRAA